MANTMQDIIMDVITTHFPEDEEKGKEVITDLCYELNIFLQNQLT